MCGGRGRNLMGVWWVWLENVGVWWVWQVFDRCVVSVAKRYGCVVGVAEA